MRREDFPILSRMIDGRPMIYLDNTATSQTPRQVVEAVERMYFSHKANVHRGTFTVAREATELLEAARADTARWLNARSASEIIFTRGTTEGLNLVAASYGGEFLREGDHIILTMMEHHANIVPWQLLQKRVPIEIDVVPLLPDGSLDLDAYRNMFTDRTRLVSFCHISNVLGTVNPVAEMVAVAHEHGAVAVVDGAQATPHMAVDVQALGADFYAFSSHKMYGPTGIGVLYGREELLEKMPPYQGGGEMIDHVSFAGTTFAPPPLRFEAGTPDFVGIAAFAEALRYIGQVGIENIAAHEQKLLAHAIDALADVPGMRVFGTAPGKCALISFLIGDSHPYDVGTLLDHMGVAVRTGHHCAQPLMDWLGIPGTVRASFAFYNTIDEVDAFAAALRRVARMLHAG
ncbi:MAG: cysteine desulfurase [Muribaculaceae bacterium]|nr:cysteine desulfurase [Muribaculaceae bacterium]